LILGDIAHVRPAPSFRPVCAIAMEGSAAIRLLGVALRQAQRRSLPPVQVVKTMQISVIGVEVSRALGVLHAEARQFHSQLGGKSGGNLRFDIDCFGAEAVV